MLQPTAGQKIPRSDVITDAFLSALEEAGVVEAWLFGSFSRGDEGAESDIDLLVKFGRDVPLFERLRIADQLSRIAGRHVDLLVDIEPVFDPYIRPTLIPIPL